MHDPGCVNRYPLPRYIVEKAYYIALQRNSIAKASGRPNGRDLWHYQPGEGYGDLEINWQGAIGELMVYCIVPPLALAQPVVISGIDTFNTDFTTPSGKKVEVKCNRFLGDYPRFFVNRHIFDKKPCDYLLCTCINDHPSKATVFTILGYLEAAKVRAYPLEERYASPAYSVPVGDINPDVAGLFLEGRPTPEVKVTA